MMVGLLVLALYTALSVIAAAVMFGLSRIILELWLAVLEDFKHGDF